MLYEKQIREAISDRAMPHGSDQFAGLGIQVQDRRAILKGRVRSLWAQKVAEEVAYSMPQIYAVENQLKIKGEGMAVSDEALRVQISQILELEPATHSTPINVSVSSGQVTLEGRVGSYPQKVRAEELASVVEGVVAVKNRLSVDYPEKLPDTEIAADIYRALRDDATAHTESISVDVVNGVVTLSGTVPTWTIYLDAEDTARHTPGVRSVRNQLTIE